MGSPRQAVGHREPPPGPVPDSRRPLELAQEAGGPLPPGRHGCGGAGPGRALPAPAAGPEAGGSRARGGELKNNARRVKRVLNGQERRFGVVLVSRRWKFSEVLALGTCATLQESGTGEKLGAQLWGWCLQQRTKLPQSL